MTKEEATAIIIGAAIVLRNIFRRYKHYEEADKIRNALIVLGVNIEDKKCND